MSRSMGSGIEALAAPWYVGKGFCGGVEGMAGDGLDRRLWDGSGGVGRGRALAGKRREGFLWRGKVRN